MSTFAIPFEKRTRGLRQMWDEDVLREQFIEVIKDKQHIERYAV